MCDCRLAQHSTVSNPFLLKYRQVTRRRILTTFKSSIQIILYSERLTLLNDDEPSKPDLMFVTADVISLIPVYQSPSSTKEKKKPLRASSPLWHPQNRLRQKRWCMLPSRWWVAPSFTDYSILLTGHFFLSHHLSTRSAPLNDSVHTLRSMIAEASMSIPVLVWFIYLLFYLFFSFWELFK
jgi:hypothetical protein